MQEMTSISNWAHSSHASLTAFRSHSAFWLNRTYKLGIGLAESIASYLITLKIMAPCASEIRGIFLFPALIIRCFSFFTFTVYIYIYSSAWPAVITSSTRNGEWESSTKKTQGMHTNLKYCTNKLHRMGEIIETKKKKKKGEETNLSGKQILLTFWDERIIYKLLFHVY